MKIMKSIQRWIRNKAVEMQLVECGFKSDEDPMKGCILYSLMWGERKTVPFFVPSIDLDEQPIAYIGDQGRFWEKVHQEIEEHNGTFGTDFGVPSLEKLAERNNVEVARGDARYFVFQTEIDGNPIKAMKDVTRLVGAYVRASGDFGIY